MVKKTVYLAAPFNSYINPQTRRIYDDKIDLIRGLIDYLKTKGYEVHNSHTRENWGEDVMKPEICTPLDYDHVRRADLIIAIPGDPPSGGVHIELGWASALGKRIIILLSNNEKYSNVILGLNRIADVSYVNLYDDVDRFCGLDNLV